jgi:GntR family transcriptional regulator/MocR family aminotransferase
MDGSGEVPLYRQIYLRFRQSIADGQLLAGERVPSVRALAAELNLARGTVEAAYQLLIGEGYLQARGPAGTVVAPLLQPIARPSPMTAENTIAPTLVHSGAVPGPLQIGLPALDEFPRKLWNRLASHELRHSGVDGLIYPDSRGDAGLRAAVAGYLGVSRGIVCAARQVFICAGYPGILDLICRSLLKEGDQCWFEEPGYFLARRFLQEAGAQLVPVAVDAEGLNVEEGRRLADDARFAVVTPSHQSPLGVSLSLPRRQALLDWANRKGSWIIEDDYDSEYRYQGRPLPALKSIDNQGRVLYAGTFSKVLAPGLRLAYLVVPEIQVERFAVMADRMHNHCPQLLQATVATFIRNGHFARHLKKMRSLYAQRRALLIDALHEHLGERLKVDQQAGGMHIVGHLPAGYDDGEVAEHARLLGLAAVRLSVCYAGSENTQGLMLGFTNVASAQQAGEVVALLAKAISSAAPVPM